MKTYIIQYFEDGSWQNYRTPNCFGIEFVILEQAQHVAIDLAAFHELLPSRTDEWRIKSSEGDTYPINETVQSFLKGNHHVSENATGSGT
jgi:hypothetical protein